MQGGDPNNNPYGGYPGGNAHGGYRGGMDASRGRGGGMYYPQGNPGMPQGHQQQPQQQQQQQQMYVGGAPSMPMQQGGMPYRGGYVQRGMHPGSGYPPQQMGYPPQGGVSQGYPPNAGGYYPPQNVHVGGGYGMQQPYPQRGGYYGGRGYGAGGAQQMQQQQQQPYYNNPNQGFRGGAYRGGFTPRPGRGGRGRGDGFSRGGGRGGMYGPRRELYCTILLDNYSQVEEVGRKGTLETIVPPAVMKTITTRARGGTIRALLVVNQKYLGACVSTPRGTEDIILSQKTAEAFMDISYVLGDDGRRIVDMQNGSSLPRHLYAKMRSGLMRVTSFDKPSATADEAAVDLQTTPASELLSRITTDEKVYNAVSAAMAENSEASLKLFSNLMQGYQVSEGATEEEEEENAEEAENNDDEKDKDAGAQPADGTTTKTTVKAQEVLLNSPQGIQILYQAMSDPSKRQCLFDMIKAPMTSDSSVVLTLTPGFRLLRTLFSSPLLTKLVFEFFGLVPPGLTSDVKPISSEVDIICSVMERYGVAVSSCIGGGSLVNALLAALNPNAVKSVKETQSGTGAKRSRDGGDEESQKASQPKTETQPPAAAAAVRAPASLADYQPPSSPSDWRLYYAIASSLCSGEIPQRTARPVAQDGSKSAEAPAAEEPADTVDSRIIFVAQHLIGCRLLQHLLPELADVVLSAEKDPSVKSDAKHQLFVERCTSILQSVASQSGSLVNHSHGNHIAQTLIADLAPRAIPGTPVEAIVRTFMDIIVNQIFEISVQKFSSNCVERAITASSTIPEGSHFLLQMGRALIEKGDEQLMHIASNQYGNYVVRHLCEELTGYATEAVPNTDSVVVSEAKELEMRYFKAITSQTAKLQSTPYGVGLMSWTQSQRARLEASA